MHFTNHIFDRNLLVANLIKCLKKVHKKDKDLFRLKAGENCINHRLGLYLTDLFEIGDIIVDLEYNRHLDKTKSYTEDKRAIVDIVIHKRDSDAYNVCAIECKKQRASKIDLSKINSLISDKFNYQYGVIIVYYKRELTLLWSIDNVVKNLIIHY